MCEQTIILVNQLQAASIFQMRKHLKQARYEHNQIHLLYVMPHAPVDYFQLPSMMALYEDSCREAQRRLFSLGEFFGVPAEQQWFYKGGIPQALAKMRKQLHRPKLPTKKFLSKEFHSLQAAPI